MKRPGAKGFTIVEVALAGTILVVVVSLTVSGFIHVLQAAALDRRQNKLDTNVKTAVESVKAHVRLSSLDKMFYNPAGPGPYVALSMPQARDSDGNGALELDSDHRIIWDRTLVYHAWDSAPPQLRLTTFDPRDNSLTDAQRQAQLDAVVDAGHGGSTHNGENASTRVVFQNLFAWRLSPRGITLDTYAEEVGRETSPSLGSILLEPGPHTFTFEVVGKHTNSSGYNIGIDRMVVSPCGEHREMEDQLPAVSYSGAVPVKREMQGGSWSGNHDLLFPASGVGETCSLSLDNDQWEESNFDATGQDTHDAVVEYEDFLGSRAYVVRLDGNGDSWFAHEQTGARDSEGSTPGFGETDPAGTLSNCVVRVMLRGQQVESGGWIRHSGGTCWLSFAAGGVPGSQHLRIEEAYIAECAPHGVISPDIDPESLQRLVRESDGATSFLILGASETRLRPVDDYPIDRQKSYVVSFRVSDHPQKGHGRFWTESRDPQARGSYLLPGGTAADVVAASWSTKSGLVISPRLYVVQSLGTSYAREGFYDSGVCDTKLDSPTYTDIEWEADTPVGTLVELQVRTGSDLYVSDAPAWSNVVAVTAPGAINPGHGRYVQFRAVLRSNTETTETPRLNRVRIAWQGATRLVDIGATTTRGPDYGMFKVLVDGAEVKSGLNLTLGLFETVPRFGKPQRLTSGLTTEVMPRNTGR